MGSQAGANLVLNLLTVYYKFNAVYLEFKSHKTVLLWEPPQIIISTYQRVHPDTLNINKKLFKKNLNLKTFPKKFLKKKIFGFFFKIMKWRGMHKIEA